MPVRNCRESVRLRRLRSRCSSSSTWPLTCRFVVLLARRCLLVHAQYRALARVRRLEGERRGLCDKRRAMDMERRAMDEQRRVMDEQHRAMDEQRRTLEEERRALQGDWKIPVCVGSSTREHR